MRLQVAADPHSEQWFALLQLHHITCDHVTTDSVLSEVLANIEGRLDALPEAIPYRNHVVQALAHTRAQDAEAFFRRKLGDVEEQTAPYELLDVHGDGSRIEEARQELAVSLSQRVRTQARRCGVSAATLFHAAWALVVSHTSGREDVVLGTVLLGRLQGSAGAQRILGMFINTLPLRLRLTGVTAQGLVEQTQRELVELLGYEQASLAMAQRCSAVAATAPLFTTLLNYRHHLAHHDARHMEGSGVSVVASQSRTNYPILLSVDDLGEGFELIASTDRRVDPQRLTGYLHTAVQSLVEALESAPHSAALQLSKLPACVRQQLIERFNATQAAYPQKKLIQELFEEQVQRAPDAVAVVYEDQSLSYGELNARSNQLARYLREKGVGADLLVGICVDRCLEMVVGVLGILKAGGAYVPLDPSYPPERLHYMVQDAAAPVILTQGQLRSVLPPSDAEVIELDGDRERIGRCGTQNLPVEELGVRAVHLAYVIYTSGSTGKPKGVMIEHRNAVNLICWARSAPDRTMFLETLQSTSLNFDLSVYECFVPLSVGGSIRIVVNALASAKQHTAVTLINTVPSAK